MTIEEVAKRFGVSETAVAAWIEDGLPIGEDADLIRVAGWLYQKGYIESFKYTATSMTDVARFFGVGLDTVCRAWKVHPEFPFRKRANRRHSVYPLHEIAEWKRKRENDPERLAKEETDESQSWVIKRRQAEARIKIVDADRKELQLKRERGEIIYRNQIEPAIAEVINGSKLFLRRIPEEMMPFFPKDQRIELAQELRGKIDAALNRMADWLATAVDQSMEESDDD